MENVAKGSDRRRLFTAEFKRTQSDRISKGEMFLAEGQRTTARSQQPPAREPTTPRLATTT